MRKIARKKRNAERSTVNDRTVCSLFSAKCETYAMARPTWTGTISFALLSIPVKLYTAQRSKDISFNQIEKATGQRIKQRRVSSVSGEEVTSEQIVRGFDLGGGRFVEIDDAELDALSPRDPGNEKTIRILDFVELDDIDPLCFEKGYYLAPDKGGLRPYALLAKAMEESGKVAVAKVVMRTKEYLAAIRPKGNMLVLETLYFGDEVTNPMEISELAEVGSVEIGEKELTMAKMLVEQSTSEFNHATYQDEYRVKVEQMIETKAAGGTFEAPAEIEPAKVVDLMAALEASIKAQQERKAQKSA